MAVAIAFMNGSMSEAQYRETLSRLEAAGAGAPPGRLYHAAFGESDKLQVFDIWESMEHFEAFGGTLMPILQELGADPGEPTVSPLANTITG